MDKYLANCTVQDLALELYTDSGIEDLSTVTSIDGFDITSLNYGLIIIIVSMVLLLSSIFVGLLITLVQRCKN